jgi:hypothetical protein
MLASLPQPTLLMTDEEQCIYDYFLQMTEDYSPEQSIKQFTQFFFYGLAQDRPEVQHTLARLVLGWQDESMIAYLLNRCFHILINRWLMQPRTQPAIVTLIERFAAVPAFTHTDSLTIRRLRYRAQCFINSERNYSGLKNKGFFQES